MPSCSCSSSPVWPPCSIAPPTSTLILSLGVAVFAAVDIAHLHHVSSQGAASPASMPELWSIGVLLFGLAAWAPMELRRPDLDTAHAGLSGIPVVFAFVSLAVLAAGVDHHVNVVASLLALAAVSLVVARTALTVRELRRANESFQLARTDDLTSLTNRRGFLEGLDRLIDASPRPLAVLVADLNGFKDVNDSLGHHAGDSLLRLVAERFSNCLGTSSLLARLGGDEFGVVAVVDHPGAGMQIAHALRATLDDPFLVEGVTVRIGASFGVAVHPTHGTSRSAVLRCADVAMYDAKRTQTDVAMYRATLDFNTRDNLQLLDDLRDAIERHALCLHYQPKVDLRSGMITGSEALVRWRHPTRGLLFPDSFVPLAERANLILGLTRAVLAEAISYHAQHFSQLDVSVNISHRDLVDDDLAGYIGELLTVHRFPPSQLTLEITETALAHDPERAAHSIAQLREAGIRVSIDDFGVGYSSMARLLELQVDEVKIDKSFVLATMQDTRPSPSSAPRGAGCGARPARGGRGHRERPDAGAAIACRGALGARVLHLSGSTGRRVRGVPRPVQPRQRASVARPESATRRAPSCRPSCSHRDFPISAATADRPRRVVSPLAIRSSAERRRAGARRPSRRRGCHLPAGR